MVLISGIIMSPSSKSHLAPYWTTKQLLANSLVQFGCVGHQTLKSKVNEPRVHFPYKQTPTIPGEGTIQEEVIKSFLHYIVVENTIVISKYIFFLFWIFLVLNMQLRSSQKKTLFLGKQKEFESQLKLSCTWTCPIRALLDFQDGNPIESPSGQILARARSPKAAHDQDMQWRNDQTARPTNRSTMRCIHSFFVCETPTNVAWDARVL